MSWEQPFKFPPRNQMLPLARWDALWETSGERTEERATSGQGCSEEFVHTWQAPTSGQWCSEEFVHTWQVQRACFQNVRSGFLGQKWWDPPCRLPANSWWFLREVVTALVYWFRSRIKRCCGTFSWSSSLSTAQRRLRLLSAVVRHWWMNQRFGDSAVITPRSRGLAQVTNEENNQFKMIQQWKRPEFWGP